MKTKIYISLLFLWLLSFASEVNGQARLIMLDNQRSQVRSSNLDFTALDTLVSVGVVQPDGACVSLGLGKVFWVEGGGKQPLKVANLDGTNVQILDTFNTSGKQIMPRGITINEYEGKLYVIGMGGYAICNLDGSNMNVVLSSLIRGRQIAINPNLGKMYFTDQSSRVFYANLDGTNRDTILKSGGSSTWGVRTDLVNNKLYFSDNRGVYRSNFDGSQRDTVFRTNVGLYLAIDIDPINNRFSYANNSGLRKRIYKGTLNPLVLTDSASHDGNIFDLTVGTLSNRQATNINFSNIGASSVTARWTKGNGTSRVAFLKADTAGWPVPLDGISYTANTTFGSGTQIGSSGWFCVYNGADSVVTISGLTANTRYRLMVCEYSGTGSNLSYNRAPANLNPLNVTTTASTTPPIPGLSITSYVPQSGNVGSSVTVKGRGFINVTKVWFGAAPAASFTVVNDSTINAVVPNNAYMGNIAVATTTGFKIGKEYFYVKNPQNVMIGNTGQTGAYFLKDGKLYGQYIYYFDNGQSYRYCPVEMPPKGSLRGKTISQLSTSGTWNLIALASDNTVHTQGNNNFRQLGDSSMVNNRALPTDITNKGDLKGKTVIQVLAGSNRFYALTSDGIVCSWGKDTLGSLGNGASTNGRVWTPTSIANRGSLAGKTIIKLCKGTDAVNDNNVFAIASDGTVHGWGPNLNSSIGVTHNNVVEDPIQITQNGVLNGKTIVDIDSKNSATILQDEDGILYGMGSSMNLGLSGATIRTTPDLLNMGSTSSLNNNRVLSMILNRTSGSAIVVDTAGKVHAFGNNASAHLGTGNSSNAIPPVLVEASTSSIAGKVVVGLAQTNYAYYVTTSDNQMHVFGSAGNYQLMNGLNSPNAPIAQLIGSPKPVPSLDATNLVFSNITSSSATIKCTPGSGVGRMIVVKANNKIDTIGPANGVNYIPSTSMNGSVIDTSARVVYRGYGDSVNITNLVNGTLYHVSVFEFDTFSNPCRYDIFKLGTPLMGSFIATSASQLATVRTSSATLITTNSATLGGNVTADGGASVTERGIVYATTANPTTANTKVAIGSGMGNFSQNITGLTAATTYHVRAYAINSVGTSYGGDSTFTTLPIPPSFAPTVRTSSAFNVTATSALLGGSVLDSGTSSIIERGVVFSTSPNPTLANSKRIFPNPSVVALSVTGLTPSTLYHVRFYATNSTGTGYGGDSTFTTLPIPTAAPKVSTAQASLVGVTSATLGGNVSDSGTATVTERGIVYATTANPTTANTKVIIGSGIGSFSQNITGLTAATTYHVRAYAINSVGTSYGGDSTFTTASVPVTSLTLSTSFDPFVTCEGIASSEQQFTVSGVNLSSDVTVNAPTGFEISLTLGGTYAASLNLTPVSGTLAITTLYIRLSSAATGVPAGNISAASTGAITQNQSINGTVNPAPAKPVINMQPASPICVGAKQLNFGAANEPPAGITYQWSTSSNASVYAQGSTKQYALISFPNAGSSKVILTASNGSCSASTELDVLVQTETTHEAIVSYFNNNFVCKANLVSAYQWGYDDKPVLKGNVIEGEINQNYFNASPDLTSKSYWVISTKGNCYQKTYYNAPSGLSNALAQSNAIKAFPNPFTHTITVTAEKGLQNYQISILDAQGKLWLQQLANSQSIELNLGNLSSGIYFIHVQDENGNISNIKMVKH